MLKKFKSIQGKDKNILVNIFASFVIRGGSLAISLISLPLYIKYFEDQQILGMWFTVVSVLTWILNFDLGIGNGLRNQLVEPLLKKDTLKIKKYISSAYFMIGSIVSVIMVIAIYSFPLIEWNILLNIPINTIDNNTLLKCVLIIFAGIMIQFFLRLITSILYSLQISFLPNLLNLISNTIILFFIIFYSSSSVEKNLIILSWVNLIAVNLPLLIVTIIIFFKVLKESRPNIKFVKLEYSKNVMKLGGIFFFIQVFYMLIVNTNEFLISWLVGPEYVVEYQIYNRLFTVFSTILSLALIPIWSAVSKALAEKDYVWITRIYKKLQFLAIIFIVIQFLTFPFLQTFVDLWLGKNSINIKMNYAFIFAIASSIYIWNSILSSIVNGIGKLKIQFILYAFGVVLKFTFAYTMIDSFEGWTVIIIANIIALLPYSCIQPILLRKYLREKRCELQI